MVQMMVNTLNRPNYSNTSGMKNAQGEVSVVVRGVSTKMRRSNRSTLGLTLDETANQKKETNKNSILFRFLDAG